MNALIIDGESYRVVEVYFKAYINRANHDRPEHSFRGVCLLVEAVDHVPPIGTLPVNVYAASIPISVRTWKEFDGQVVEYEGDSSWNFTLCNGHYHHVTENNRWEFKQLERNLFQVNWDGHITDFDDLKSPFLPQRKFHSKAYR